MQTDRALVVRAQGGDRAAFSDLAAGRIDRLVVLARLILRDPTSAEDAVQEALVGAWRGLPSLRDPDRFDAWLRRLLIRACSEQARHLRRGVTELTLLPTDGPPVADGQLSLARRDQLERGLRRLPVELRTVLVLVYYLDLPLTEAAQAMGIPLGTVKSRLHRAHDALRAELEADARASHPKEQYA